MSKTKIQLNKKIFDQIKKNSSSEISQYVKYGFNELLNLDKLLNGNINSIPKQSVQNYYVVRLVTLSESVFRQTFVFLIDEFDMDFQAVVTLDLKDLKRLRTNTSQYTNGQIAAQSLNFQDLDHVYSNLKKILGSDVFTLMVKKNKKIKPINQSLKDLIDERHSIVHDLQNTVYTPKFLENFSGHLLTFLRIFLNATAELRDKKIKNP